MIVTGLAIAAGGTLAPAPPWPQAATSSGVALPRSATARRRVSGRRHPRTPTDPTLSSCSCLCIGDSPLVIGGPLLDGQGQRARRARDGDSHRLSVRFGREM